MVSPKKRKNSRSEKRASQRYTPPGVEVGGGGGTIPRPPESCAPFHFYWCDGHNDWHHHDEFVVTAIERTLSAQQPVQDTVEGTDGRFRIEGLDEL
jgi:hypothetical protein